MGEGRFRDAGVAVLAAPVLMSYVSTASLVMDVMEGAYELAGPAFQQAGARL